MDSEDPDTDGKTNVCPICKNGYPTMRGLKQHWSRGHTDEEINAAVAEKMGSTPQQPPTPEASSHPNSLQIILNDGSLGKIYHQFNIIENGGAACSLRCWNF